jgi:hypothetical protein
MTPSHPPAECRSTRRRRPRSARRSFTFSILALWRAARRRRCNIWRSSPIRGRAASPSGARIGEGGFDLVGVTARRATIGVTRGILQPGPVARWDHAASVEVGIAGGALASVSDVEALAGKTTLAIQGEDGAWEILAFARAELVAANVWRLSRLLRGLGGESHLAGRSVAAGAPVVLLDSALFPLTGNSAEPGAPALYRIGPADRDHADAELSSRFHD